ncbi:MAG: hypothetical protein IK134_08065 [Oscillospiraceae bacterium]|nr:hypothetical protein [Oscillospiraceae bacterium]
MIDKFAVSCMTTYYKAKAKFEKLCKGEDGMETLETIILIAIAVIVASFIINFLTKGKFEGSDKGLIGYMFNKIGDSIKTFFTTDTSVNPTE